MNLHEFLTGIGFFAKYPYTDFHELNLDWAITEIARLRVEFDDFAHVNSLKYAGEWDITKSYSAFSVVDDHGFGYMALKPVPPGTQINDAEYWLMVVDYSQITQDYENRISALEQTVGDASSGLVKDVDDLQTDMSNAQNDIGTLQNDVGTLQNTVGDANSGLVKDVDDLQTDMTNAQNDIIALQNTVGDASSGLVKDVDDLQTDMTNAQNDIQSLFNIVSGSARKFIFCGDSYSVGSYGNVGWIDLVESYLGLVAEQDAYDARNLVQYYGGSFAANTFKDQIIALAQHITDRDKITDIYLFAGANEYTYTPADTYNGMSSFMQQCKTYFPKAVVKIGFIGALVDPLRNRQFGPFIDTYKRIGELGGVYVQNSEYINSLFSDYNADGIHPNDYAPMSRLIAQAVIEGSVGVKKKFQASGYTAGAGASALNSCAFNITQINDSVNIAGVLSFVSGTNIGENAVTIATRSTPIDIINAPDDNACAINIDLLYISGATVKTIPVLMTITAKEVKIRTYTFESNAAAVIPSGATIALRGQLQFLKSASAINWTF